MASSFGTLVNWFPSRYLEEESPQNRILIQMTESIVYKSRQIITKKLGLLWQETELSSALLDMKGNSIELYNGDPLGGSQEVFQLLLQIL